MREPGRAARLAAGERLYEADRFLEAERIFRGLIADEGAFFEAAMALGSTLSRREKWAEAEAMLQEALRLRPDSSPAALLLARAMISQGRPQEGEAVMRRAVELAPYSMRARLELGRLYVAMKSWVKAERALGEATRLDPKNVDIYLERLPLRLQRGDYDGAFADAESAISLGLRTEEQIEKLTFPFGEQGRPPWSKAAVRQCEQALTRYRQDASGAFWAKFYLSGLRLHLDLDRVFEEIPALSAQATGRYAFARWLIGLSHMRERRWNEAIAELGPILRRYPFFIRVGFLIGEALLGQNKTAQALSFLSRLEPAQGSQRGIWLSWMGEIHFRLKDFQRALPYLDDACARGDELPLAVCWRGGCRLGLGQPEEALADLDRAVERVPIDGEPYYLRAHAHLSLRRYPEARRDLEKYLAVFPDDAGMAALRELLVWQFERSFKPDRFVAIREAIAVRWPQMEALLPPQAGAGRLDGAVLAKVADCVLSGGGFSHYFHPYQSVPGTEEAWPR